MTCCKICSGQITEFGRAQILAKYDVRFIRCSHCGFIQSEEPYWLDEAYTSAINQCDVGLVRRNEHLATIMKIVIGSFFDANGRFLDYAGGYGLFVRLMRDRGFDFYWYDKYCENIFAQQFEAMSEVTTYDVLTAFEVFEHLVDPEQELLHMLSYSRNIVFTTELLPHVVPSLDEWWYFGLDHGQHVSFYTRKSLRILAEKNGLNYCTDGVSLHLFTEKKISPILFFILSQYKVSRVLDVFYPRTPLITADYKKIAGKRM